MGHIAAHGHNVHGIHFPPAAIPPGSSEPFFLAGAGPRGVNIAGEFVLFTAIAIYFHDTAMKSLAKYKGKSAEELNNSHDFFQDIYAGNFEWMTRVTMVHPLTGPEYSGRVAENCMKAWQAVGIYNDANAHALEQFKEAFKDQNFPHGASIFFHRLAAKELRISFSKDGVAPKKYNAVINNDVLGQSVLQSIIGEHGVSRGARRNIAARMSHMLNNQTTSKVTPVEVEL